MKVFKIWIILLAFTGLVACYDDLGNYDYTPLAELTIDNIPEVIEVLGGSDHIVITPKITSSKEGEIKEGNPNFEFTYKIQLSGGGKIQSNDEWLVLNPDGAKDLDTLASFQAREYVLSFSVKDKRTEVTVFKKAMLKVTSVTTEGWMVLCEEGASRRVRMDMVSYVTSTQKVVLYDLLTPRGLTNNTRAYQVLVCPTAFANPGNRLYVLTGEGCYLPNYETLDFFASNGVVNIELNNLYKADAMPGRIPQGQPRVMASLLNGSSGSGAMLYVSDQGNAYCKYSSYGGPVYQNPINTLVEGEIPTYKVAPFIGFKEGRTSYTYRTAYSAIFYDMTNKRFVGWSQQSTATQQKCTPLVNPTDNMLFDYNTGMDMVYMENTRFGGGITYAIMQAPNGDRHIYGFSYPSNYVIAQASADVNVPAPGFKQAEHFAFHSQYTFTYYAVGNVVYCYDRGTRQTKEVFRLPAGEEVTRLKFNLYQWDLSATYLAKKREGYIDAQYQLIVGSYDSSKGNSGGTLYFLKVDNLSNTLTETEKFSGFAKITDVIYKEIR